MSSSNPRDTKLPLTDQSFLQKGATWPPPEEAGRIGRYLQNRELWRGNHTAVFGDWWRVLREDKNASLEMIFNWHKRISTLWADLLVGEPPRFLDSTDPESGPGADTGRQLHVDRIAGKDNNAYSATLYEVALDVSRYGDGLVKITLEEEGAAFWAQPPHYWFPIVDPANLRKFTHHVLAWTFKHGKEGSAAEGVDTNDKQDKYLWAEIHEKGSITRKVFRIEGNLIGDEQPVEFFNPEALSFENTGIDDFLVIPFAGLLASDEIHGEDDYKDLDSIVQALEVRSAQINKVLDKHTEPNMYGSPDYLKVDAQTGKPYLETGSYYPTDEGDDPPGYITWEGHLEWQFKEMEFLIEQLYIISSTSPAAFGKLEGGLAESGSALKRLMQAPLAKVARIRLRFDPATKRALKLAAQLETAHGRGTPEILSVHVVWQDGLPPDDKEAADTEATKVGAELSSHVSAIQRLEGGTVAEAKQEHEAILEEAQTKADSAFEIQKKEAALTEGQDERQDEPFGKGDSNAEGETKKPPGKVVPTTSGSTGSRKSQGKTTTTKK